jgi:hypothetical protein
MTQKLTQRLRQERIRKLTEDLTRHQTGKLPLKPKSELPG